MTINTTTPLVSFPVQNGLWPGASNIPEFLPGGIGPRVLPFTFDFTAATGSNGTPISGDFEKEQELKQLGIFQSIFIDNSKNTAQPFTIQLQGGPNQFLSIAKATQAILPIYGLQTLRFTAATTGAVLVPVLFCNFAQPYAVWASQ
jgi:hypothetical protein